MMIDPPHIGSFIRTEIIEANGLNVSTGAKALGVTRQALSTLLNCHSGLSPDMALRLEKAFGVRMDTLLRMQTVFDIAQARKRAPMIDVQRFEAA
jgi:antitoxin HigA-1